MKNTITTLLLSFSVLFGFNQIIVTNNNFIQIGDTIQGYTTTTGVPSPGSSGANQVWNFSSNTATPNSPTIYVDPITTPYASQFPSSNLASVIQGTYNYEEQSGQDWLFLGLRGTSFTPGDYYFTYQPPHYVARFPIQYQDTYTQNYVKHYFLLGNTSTYDSIVADYQTQIVSNVDGWGTLMTPSGSYQALREYRDETDVITQLMYKNGAVISNTTYTINVDSYYWWSENVTIKHPIAIHNTSSTGTGGSSSWNYYDIGLQAPVGISDISDFEISVFPNPTRGEFFIESNSPFELIVYDHLGKTIPFERYGKQYQITNENPGVYFLKITTVEETYTKKLILH
ncbi:MAG: T9SS type A sorting domain-containing protein [Flavobacteriales bacterium]|nr:T9SS type A sorting domain-containing protein [Flavobacteriales bacterium]